MKFICQTLTLFALVALASTALARNGVLEIYNINVGQGDATLIVGPTGTTVLVDAGMASPVTRLMDSLGLNRIDYTVATHYDADHIGGFLGVMKRFPPAIAAYDRGGDRRASAAGTKRDDTPIGFFQNYLASANANGLRRTPITGQAIDLGGDARIWVLAVGVPDFQNGNTDNRTTVLRYLQRDAGGRLRIRREQLTCANTENEKSIALLVTFGDFDFLIAGDLTGIANAPIACNADRLNVEGPVGTLITAPFPMDAGTRGGLGRQVDVYHVDHHGSRTTSNSAAYLNLINPTVAVMSVGDEIQCGDGFNVFGHPGQEVIDRLIAPGGLEAIFQTEEGGVRRLNVGGDCVGRTADRDYEPPVGMPPLVDFAYQNHIKIMASNDGTYTVQGSQNPVMYVTR